MSKTILFSIIVGVISVVVAILYAKFQYDLCMSKFNDVWYCIRHAGIL